MNEIIKVISDEMAKQGVTNYRLAQLTGLSQPTIASMLRGESSPSLDTLNKVCEALNLKITISEDKEFYSTGGHQ